MFDKNPIHRIASVLPPALVSAFEKQTFYSTEEVKRIFDSELKTKHNVEYAFAMFCSQAEFEKLGLASTYNDLRLDVSKTCFGNWPRFNFESLLDYSRRSTIGGESVVIGGEGGCGDGGCGGGGE
ncbi:conserved hypothetical protein [Alteromonas sp. 38]|uniref:DUF6559 family protein n=1 Tax=unclassified Alteromonas TaxID=2614992 RepID=UPI0012F239C2|nr:MULTISPECIES: DUF6559 family protein [unclassified Alteromonas]CAD5275768.1 conserved hypothetical protein [Alteromonas sp. 154]VXB66281.1 conserved hypothetical protein [Alteromonas sp. 38]